MSEQNGRLRRELTAAYEARGITLDDSDLLAADAIDRLAADVAAVKEAVGRIEAVAMSTAVTLTPTAEQAAALRAAASEIKATPVAPQPATVSDAQPSAWGILRVGGSFVDICGSAHHAESSRMKWDEAEGWVHEVVPLAPHSSRRSTMTEETSLDELQMLVHTWADERKILSDSSPQAQLVKLTEEVGELAAGVCRDDQQKIIDSIGDTAVVLIVMCGILRVSFRRCLQAAYDEIKGRSGTIEGGVFVKTSDAAPQPAANHPKTLDSSPAAPQPAAPPAGWLTEEERELLTLVKETADGCLMVHSPWRPNWPYARMSLVVESILARAGSPPVVEVPAADWGAPAARVAAFYRAAINNAGLAWKEVGRE